MSSLVETLERCLSADGLADPANAKLRAAVLAPNGTRRALDLQVLLELQPQLKQLCGADGPAAVVRAVEAAGSSTRLKLTDVYGRKQLLLVEAQTPAAPAAVTAVSIANN